MCADQNIVVLNTKSILFALVNFRTLSDISISMPVLVNTNCWSKCFIATGTSSLIPWFWRVVLIGLILGSNLQWITSTLRLRPVLLWNLLLIRSIAIKTLRYLRITLLVWLVSRSWHLLVLRSLHVLILRCRHLLVIRGLNVLILWSRNLLVLWSLHLSVLRSLHLLIMWSLHVLNREPATCLWIVSCKLRMSILILISLHLILRLTLHL
jgi:hypothetical protein